MLDPSIPLSVKPLTIKSWSEALDDVTRQRANEQILAERQLDFQTKKQALADQRAIDEAIRQRAMQPPQPGAPPPAPPGGQGGPPPQGQLPRLQPGQAGPMTPVPPQGPQAPGGMALNQMAGLAGGPPAGPQEATALPGTIDYEGVYNTLMQQGQVSAARAILQDVTKQRMTALDEGLKQLQILEGQNKLKLGALQILREAQTMIGQGMTGLELPEGLATGVQGGVIEARQKAAAMVMASCTDEASWQNGRALLLSQGVPRQMVDFFGPNFTPQGQARATQLISGEGTPVVREGLVGGQPAFLSVNPVTKQATPIPGASPMPPQRTPPVVRFQRVTVEDAQGNVVLANYDSISGKHYDANTGQEMPGVRTAPTAETRNRRESLRGLVPGLRDLRLLSESIIATVGPQQRLDAMRRGVEAVFGSDPNFRVYQDVRAGLAAMIAVAIQGSRPSDADVFRSAMPMIPDPYSDTKESAKKKWEIVFNMFRNRLSPEMRTELGFEQAAGSPPPAAASTFSVVAPDGRTYTFPNQAALDGFKKAAGIK